MVKARLRTEDGVSIEVEASTQEYEEALATTLRAIRRAAASSSTDDTPSSAELRQMVEKLSTDAVEYLRLLVENPDGLSDEEITNALGLETRQKLAGLNGSITKVADRVGLEGDDIIRRTVGRGPQGRTYHYVVPDGTRAKLTNVLPEEPEPAPSRKSPPPPADDDVPF